MSNPYEVAARLKKAYKLADECSAAGISSEDLERGTEEDWKLLARAAKVHPPSGDDTKRAVVEILKTREAKQ